MPKIGYIYSVQFSWDPRKAASNLKKHRVSFAEAQTVLENPLTDYAPDLDHDDPRLRALGESSRGRLLYVVCVEYGDDHLRIISARRADSQEREDYEKSH